MSITTECYNHNMSKQIKTPKSSAPPSISENDSYNQAEQHKACIQQPTITIYNSTNKSCVYLITISLLLN